MRILFIARELSGRGTPRALYNYVRTLSDSNDVLIWSYLEGGRTADELRAIGTRVVIGQAEENHAFSFQPEVVNFHRAGVHNPYELELLKRAKQNGAFCIETNVFGRVDAKANQYIDLSIHVSQWDLFQWRHWCRKERPDSIYLPNMVDTRSFSRVEGIVRDSLRAKWGVSNVGFIIGCIGNTSWKKIAQTLFNVLQSDESLHFVTVENTLIPDMIRRHSRVHVIPRMSSSAELCRFYSACDTILSLSVIGESFGFVNAESLACGTPVLALSTPLHCNAQIEVIEHLKTGVLIANIECLSTGITAIKSLLKNKCLHKVCARSIIEKYSDGKWHTHLSDAFARSYTQSATWSWTDVKNRLQKVIGTYPLGVLTLAHLYYTPWGFRLKSFFLLAVRVFQKFSKDIL